MLNFKAMNCSLGAFIPTFERPVLLRENVDRLLLEQTRPPDVVLVVDNGEDSRTEALVRDCSRVVYKRMGRNLGSAGGTAYGVRWLFEQGYDYIHCGDDDNPPITTDTLERLLRILKESGKDVAGVGGVGATWDWNKGRLVRFSDEKLHGILDVDMIGGGHHLMLKSEAVRTVGFPNENLFFGYPDLEYCLRIRKAGYRLLVDADLMRIYRERHNKLNVKVTPSAVPRRSIDKIWRDYYTTRNFIHMMRNTFQRNDLARGQVIKSLVKTIGAWANGPRYGATYTYLQLRSIVDGYSGRLGLVVPPRSKSSPKSQLL